MTVPSEDNRVSYTGAGTTGPFTIPYYFLENDDLLVIKTLIADGTETELALTTDYTVTGAGDEAGGELTLAATLLSSYTLTIVRDPDRLQQTDYSANDKFPAESHERALDKLTMIVQRVYDIVTRSLRQPDGDTADIAVLPSKVDRASNFLAFDADGDPIASAGVVPGSVPVSTFMETVLDDTSAAAALATLGTSAVQGPRTFAGGMNFNGTTTYLDGNALTGIADSKMFTWYATVRFANSSGVTNMLHSSTSISFRIYRGADGNLYFNAKNSAGTIILSMGTTGAPLTAAGTYRILISCDMATGVSVYINDALQPLTTITFTDDTIDFTVTEHSIGSEAAGSAFLNGDFYTLWFYAGHALDISAESVRRRFYTIDPDPQFFADEFMGDNGGLPSSTDQFIPHLFLAYDRGTAWATNKGSTTSPFTLKGAIAKPSTLTVWARFERRGRTAHPEDFGAVGDGSTDDKTALTNWLNAIIANPSIVGVMQSKVYATSGALPNITANGVRIYGTGPSTSHDVGTSHNGAVIKAITNAGFTILTVAPTEGATAQRLDGVVIDGVGFAGNSLAAKNLLIKGVRRGVFNIYTEEATTSGVELGVSTTLGESTDTQENIFNIDGRQVLNNAPSLRLKGSATANVSFNDFQNVTIVHKDELGIISENADSNRWGTVRIFRAAGGAAANSIEWRGGSSAAVATRDEYINLLSTTVAAIAKGTGTYTVGATNIRVENLDYTNSTPTPTSETGTSVWVHGQRTGTWTPVLTFTTPGDLNVAYTTQIGRYIRTGRLVTVEFVILTSAFTHTTAAGNLVVTGLPFAASTVASMLWYGAVSWQGITKANYTEVKPGINSAGADIQFTGSGSGQNRSTIAFGDVPTGGTVALYGTVVYETDAAP